MATVLDTENKDYIYIINTTDGWCWSATTNKDDFEDALGCLIEDLILIDTGPSEGNAYNHPINKDWLIFILINYEEDRV